jgi:N-acetylneuraminic acid mutarotase
VATVRCFDPVLHSWTEMTPLTTRRYGAAMVVLGEHLLIIGGRNTRTLTTVERYSFVTRAWTALAPLPSARCHTTAAVHGGQLFVFGGYTGGRTVTDEVLLYDSEGERWEVVARLSQPRCLVRLASDLDGRIFVVGGLSWDAAGQPQRSSVVEYFNTSTRTVSVRPPLPEPRQTPGAVFVGGQLHVFGGGLQDGTRSSTSTSLTVGPNGSPVAGWSDPQPTLPGPMWFDPVFHDFV